MNTTERWMSAYLCAAALLNLPVALAGQTADDAPPDSSVQSALDRAHHLYYNGSYEAAAAEAQLIEHGHPDALEAYEIRTAALLFQVKRLIGEPRDKARAVKACGSCADLIAGFTTAFTTGRALAQARLSANPADADAQFFLGKLDLNYIWLHLGPLGRRTGWAEFREGRGALDALLAADPSHVRARVARAWIDYIVDTRVMFMFKWMLGGGDKDRALAVVRNAAQVQSEFFTTVEARFALWEMLTREKKFAEATQIARALLQDFPDNQDLARFVDEYGTATSRPQAAESR